MRKRSIIVGGVFTVASVAMLAAYVDSYFHYPTLTFETLWGTQSIRCRDGLIALRHIDHDGLLPSERAGLNKPFTVEKAGGSVLSSLEIPPFGPLGSRSDYGPFRLYHITPKDVAAHQPQLDFLLRAQLRLHAVQVEAHAEHERLRAEVIALTGRGYELGPPPAPLDLASLTASRKWTSDLLSPRWQLVMPLWIPLFIMVVPAAWCAKRYRAWSRVRRRQRNNQCIACGYDLTATPDRCPECGRATGSVGVSEAAPVLP